LAPRAVADIILICSPRSRRREGQRIVNGMGHFASLLTVSVDGLADVSSLVVSTSLACAWPSSRCFPSGFRGAIGPLPDPPA
jgi:hypothetical protein